MPSYYIVFNRLEIEKLEGHIIHWLETVREFLMIVKGLRLTCYNK